MSDKYRNHYYRVTPYLGVLTVLGGLGCAASYGSLGGDAAFVLFMAPIFFTTFAFASFVACWMTGASLERSLRFFREGKALGRWQVQGQQWLDFARDRRAKLATGERWAAGVFAVVLIVIAGICWDDPEIFAALGALFGLTGVGVFAYLRLVVRRPYAPGVHRADIEVGPRIAMVNGHILSFAGMGQTLTGVEIDEQRHVLIIRGRTQTNDSDMPFEHELPFPTEAKEQVLRVMVGLGYGHGLGPVDDA